MREAAMSGSLGQALIWMVVARKAVTDHNI
jgi:hypothetical protein